jgi:hypothetical protein
VVLLPMSSSAEFSTLVSDEDKLVLEEHATPTSLPSAWSYLSLLFCVVSLSVDYSVISFVQFVRLNCC